MTGSSSSEDAARASEAGFSSWLGKPFDIEELDALLAAMPVSPAASADAR